MSLHTRVSANSGRRASVIAEDPIEKAYTQLNKAMGERDRLQHSLSERLDELNSLRVELDAVKKENAELKAKNRGLEYERDSSNSQKKEVEVAYESLRLRYDVLQANTADADRTLTTTIPERPKLDRSPTKKEYPREERGRDHRAREQEERANQTKRLTDRFNERDRSDRDRSDRDRPPTSSRSSQYSLEPHRRSSSRNPTMRSLSKVRTGGSSAASHHSVPRTPASPSTYGTDYYSQSGSSGVGEDLSPNYHHAYPVTR